MSVIHTTLNQLQLAPMGWPANVTLHIVEAVLVAPQAYSFARVAGL